MKIIATKTIVNMDPNMANQSDILRISWFSIGFSDVGDFTFNIVNVIRSKISMTKIPNPAPKDLKL